MGNAIKFALALLIGVLFAAPTYAISVEDYLIQPKSVQVRHVELFLKADDSDDICHPNWSAERWTDVINKQLATGKSPMDAGAGEKWETIHPGDDVNTHIKATVIVECFCVYWGCE